MQAPKKDAKDLYLQYAELEEQFGLDRSAMAVYDQAVKSVPVDQRLSVYNIYLARAKETYGVPKVSRYFCKKQKTSFCSSTQKKVQ